MNKGLLQNFELDDDELFDDEDEGEGALSLADKGKGGKKKGAANDAEDAEDGGDDEAEELADDSEGEMYDDTADEMLDDSEDVDPEDDGGPEAEEEAPMPPKRRGKSKKAAERGRGMTLAEKRLREENAKLRFQLYETAVEKTLAAWSKGTFQFQENAKGEKKKGRIALSRAFTEAFRAYMRSEGVRLSEQSRGKLLGLVEMALSTAVVDLSERGSSYDPDGRMVSGSAARQRAGGKHDDQRLQQAAERIALAEHGKSVAALSDDPAKMLAVYEQASREVGYR